MFWEFISWFCFLKCRVVGLCVFQRKRISAVNALMHPYVEEGRIRYHACMCSCCPNALLSFSVQSIEDFEPVCQKPFQMNFEDRLSSKAEIKRTSLWRLLVYNFRQLHQWAWSVFVFIFSLFLMFYLIVLLNTVLCICDLLRFYSVL